MADLQPPPQADIPKSERRRSQRVFLVMAIELAWTKDGKRIEERGETAIVSGHGAVIRIKQAPPLNAEVDVRLPRASQWTHARVVDAREPGSDGRTTIAVALAVSDEQFWGVPLPPPPIYNFHLTATPRTASPLVELLELLQERKVKGEIKLLVSGERPFPADLWREVEELLRNYGITYEKNV